jgi:hypothetical protein
MRGFVFFCLVGTALGAEPSTNEQPPWVPAKVYSIEVGTSLLKDLTRSVGKPRQQTDNENTFARGALMYQYDVTWPANGELWAFVDARSKVVNELMFKSKVATLEDIKKVFGAGNKPVRYRRQMCDEGRKGFTLCADESGVVSVLEYRDQGVVVFPGPDNSVNNVHFVAKGLPLLNCECPGEAK